MGRQVALHSDLDLMFFTQTPLQGHPHVFFSKFVNRLLGNKDQLNATMFW